MLNKCTFIGHLGKNPDIRTTQAGKKIANLSLGVTEKWKDANGERKERTEWVRVVIFNQGLSGVAEKYLSKGSKVYVEGQMQTRKWTDQQGIEKYSTEVVLQNFGGTLVLLDSRKSDEGSAGYGQGETRQATSSSNYADMDNEIPF